MMDQTTEQSPANEKERVTLRERFDKTIEFLYGDEIRTRRTLGTCVLMLMLAFFLQLAAPLACGG